MEQNPVSAPFTFDFEGAAAAAETGGVPPVAWVLIAVVLAGAFSAILISRAASKNRQNIEQSIQTEAAQAHEGALGAAGGKAHFVAPKEALKTVTLLVVGGGEGRKVTLPISKTLFVGRSDICDVVFDDARMSRQHFVIEDMGDTFSLTNLSERGQTQLNGVPVDRPRPLAHGDIIEAGAQRIQFSIER